MSRLNPTAALAILSSNEGRGIGGTDPRFRGVYVQGSKFGFTTAAVPALLLTNGTDWVPGVRCANRYRLTVIVNSPSNQRGLLSEVLMDLIQDSTGAAVVSAVNTGSTVGSPPTYLTAATTFSFTYAPPLVVSGRVIAAPILNILMTITNVAQGGPDFYYTVEWEHHSTHFPYA